MNLVDSLKVTRDEVGVSSHIPLTHLANNTMVETKNSELISVIKIDGIPFHTEESHRLNYFHRVWHSFLCSLDDSFGVYVTNIRTKVNHDLSGKFTNSWLAMVDQKYHASFDDSGIFQNTLYLAIVYRGIHSGKIGKGVSFVQSVSQRFIKAEKQKFREYAVAELTIAVNRALSMLSEFKVELLSSEESGSNRLLSYFSYLVNIENDSSYPKKILPSIYLKDLSVTEKLKELPCESLMRYLPRKRLFFADIIKMTGLVESDSQYAAILSVKGYPEESYSLLLNSLMNLNFEWVCTQSFLYESNEVALQRIKQHCTRLKNVNDAAASQLDQLQYLPDLIQSNQVKTGLNHHTLLILSDSIDQLDGFVQKASKAYMEAGFSVVRESIGQEPAFWAQIPGNHRYIARASLITTENFADFCPLHNYDIGYRDSNHLGSAVTLLQTASKTPYFFNFHRKGSVEQLTPGHTVLIGSNGAGKTVLLTFLDAQLSRYDCCSIFFDRNRGVELYIRAVGGVYSVLSPNCPESTCFNPLLLEDTPANRQFCYKWLVQLCKKNAFDEVSASAYEQIKDCIDYGFDHVSASVRRLSSVVRALPVNFKYWSELRRWLRGSELTPEGEYAYLFDNDTDSLVSANKVGFDMTHFLDHEPAEVRTALMMYLFYWIRLQMTGKLVALYLDEAWQYFDDEFWVLELKKSIPTFRKLNAFLVLATQSAASVAHTKISHVILDNCATQLFFPNPEAKKSHYCDLFHLTEAEFNFVKNNEVNSRLFLVKQDSQSVICKLDLSSMKNELAILSTTEKSSRKVASLRHQYGERPDAWLPHYSVEEGA